MYSPNNRPLINKSGQDVYISYKYEGKTVFYDICYANEYDKSIFTPHKNCNLFRLYSPQHDVWPIVSINLDKNLLYFLNDYDVENSDWDRKGIKLDFPINKFIENNKL